MSHSMKRSTSRSLRLCLSAALAALAGSNGALQALQNLALGGFVALHYGQTLGASRSSVGDTLGKVCLRIGGSKWYRWDVTSFVARQLEGDRMVSFCIRALDESGSG